MIKLAVVDVDGCLTDGVYSVGTALITPSSLVGQSYFPTYLNKNFFSRDFHGLHQLISNNVQVAIVTSSSDNVIIDQCHRSKLHCIIETEIKDKKEFVKNKFVDKLNISWRHIAAIGDDEIDEELLKLVEVPCCPNDAHDHVQHVVKLCDNGFVSKFNGGKGAVRDFCDLILQMNRWHNEW